MGPLSVSWTCHSIIFLRFVHAHSCLSNSPSNLRIAAMGRCDKCVLISVATIRDRHFQHRESLRALKVSAETGCSLCNLFWTQLKNSCTKRAIDMHLVDRKCPNGDRTNTKIYLTGDLQDPGSGFLSQSFNQGSHVWVSAGEIDEQSSDPNVRVTTCLQVFTEPGEKSLYFCLLKGFRLL